MKVIILMFFPIFLVMCQSETDQGTGIIMTVNGPVPVAKMGISLTHEHILVDFIGADSIKIIWAIRGIDAQLGTSFKR